jgi:hypothetical protein
MMNKKNWVSKRKITALMREYKIKRDRLSSSANHRGKYSQFIADLGFLLE